MSAHFGKTADFIIGDKLAKVAEALRDGTSNSSSAVLGEESKRLYAYRPLPSRNVYAVCLPYVWREPFKNVRKYGVP